jgi:putative chitinase
MTSQQLIQLCPNLSTDRANLISAAYAELLPKYGMTDNNILHEYFANVAHESGGFRIMRESLNYTTPQRLVTVWSSRFTLTGEAGKRNANEYVNNPKKLANLVYANRMGNIHANDGYSFLGGGFAQITGRDAYTLYHKWTNSNSTIEQTALAVQTDIKAAVDSSLWFFCEFKNLEQLALQDRFKDIVKRWNGGFIGMEDRQKYYDRAKIVLSGS